MTRRVLHVLSSMNRGGIETWIMNVLRRLDRAEVAFDFFIEHAARCDYEDEIEALGGRMIRGPRFVRTTRMLAALASTLRARGPYHALHCHGRHTMGPPVALARALGVPVAIGHVHNVREPDREDLARRVYHRACNRALLHASTWILGCSDAANASLYPDEFGRVAKIETLPYGIDPDRFVYRDAHREVRAELGLPDDAVVLGHVGRFAWEKNHEYLVPLFAAVAARDPRWHLVMVGDGPLRADTTERVAAAGLTARVRFTGVRGDVPRLMSSFDVMVLPSRMEGFGLVLVEAQALGTPVVVSDTVPAGIELVPELVQRVRLADPFEAWADAIVGATARPRDAAAAHRALVASHFNIARSVDTLVHRYYGVPRA